MDAWATLVCITFGLPVALLFVAGYLIRQRRTDAERMFAVSEVSRRAPYGGNGSDHEYPPKVACWELKQCALATRDKCPAYDRTYLPCWLAVKLANGGHMQHGCVDCFLYQPERIVEGVAPVAETAAKAG